MPDETEKPNNKSNNALKKKIFPRNLTARAGYIVTGNPANSRPESGVDNCYPGLEFDQRNLEQRFFPGLIFYFHRDDGALLSGVDPSHPLTSVLHDGSLWLWGLYGRVRVEDDDESVISFRGQSGIQVWRRIHDLLPGTVALALGPAPGAAAAFSPQLRNDLYEMYRQSCDHNNAYCCQPRYSDKTLDYVVLAGPRARYLSEDGVIEPEAYAAGDLTKTLCSPWMYDFRDCYCFYWSSNKPDIVNVPVEGGPDIPYVNFLRATDNRGPTPSQDVDSFVPIIGGRQVSRKSLELSAKDMVEGWWQKLPVVLNDTESLTSIATVIPPVGPSPASLTTAEIIAELRYLATVEHAVCVEYLYAYYSINKAPVASGKDIQSITSAASELFLIATDEMRHLAWVNIALDLLGAPPSLDRATYIAEPPALARNGRRPNVEGLVYLNRPFELKPLNASTLDWFIAVEAPSKSVNEGLDGMYVHILESLNDPDNPVPNPDRVGPLIKLLIDEGDGHWRKFSQIKATLAGIPESTSFGQPINRRQAKTTCNASRFAIDITRFAQGHWDGAHAAKARSSAA